MHTNVRCKLKGMYKSGVVFGVFDLFHSGHQYFLTQSRSKCEKLIVVVTPDSIVREFKGKDPIDSFEKRMRAVQEFGNDYVVVAGDSHAGSWNIFSLYPPDVVFLGYDQQGIASELEKLHVPYVYIDAYKKEQYKTSKLRGLT